MANGTRERLYELDWLRVIAILILLAFHVGMIFVPWEWHIKSVETSRPMAWVMSWLHFWRMPLLLFISGAGTFFALRMRSSRQFLAERHKRLLVPVIFGMLVIVPPQVYIEKIAQYTSFWSFYPTIFEGTPYPAGNTSWHHLWFVVYLLIYSVLLLPLFLWLRSEMANRFFDRLSGLLRKPGAFAWFLLPIAISQAALRPFFMDETHALVDDWAAFAYYGLFFLYGFVCVRDDRIWAMIRERRREHLGWSTVLLIPFYGLMQLDNEIPFHVAGAFVAWFTLITAVGYGQIWLRKRGRLLAYSNEAIYPFYILHQTVIILVGYQTLKWGIGIYTNFLIVLVLSFLFSVGIYHFLIRPFDPVRFLFGMRPKRQAASVRTKFITRVEVVGA